MNRLDERFQDRLYQNEEDIWNLNKIFKKDVLLVSRIRYGWEKGLKNRDKFIDRYIKYNSLDYHSGDLFYTYISEIIDDILKFKKIQLEKCFTDEWLSLYDNGVMPISIDDMSKKRSEILQNLGNKEKEYLEKINIFKGNIFELYKNGSYKKIVNIFRNLDFDRMYYVLQEEERIRGLLDDYDHKMQESGGGPPYGKYIFTSYEAQLQETIDYSDIFEF